MKSFPVHDKNGNVIHEGDYVSTRIRGGTHEGEVEEIVRDAKRAEERFVNNPPKVLFHDKGRKTVIHHPGTLEVQRSAKDSERTASVDSANASDTSTSKENSLTRRESLPFDAKIPAAF